MLFLQIFRHSIESCPHANAEAKEVHMAFFAKSDQLMKKHGIKIVGSWSALPGMHLDVVVFEAPSMEALMKFSMEPEVMSLMVHNTSELYPVMTTEEEMKLFR